MEKSAELNVVLREAYDKYQFDLGTETINDMAYPSYLSGNRLSRYVFWKKLDHIVKAAQLQPRTTVLDFGCGSGILLPTLSQQSRMVFATDLRLAPAQHLAGKIGLHGIQFVDTDNWQSRIGANELDVIIAANVLEHVEDRKSLLERFAEKLAPHGRLVISGPTENTLYRFGRRIVGFTGEYHVATVKEVLQDARAVGFVEAQRRDWPFIGPFCLYQIVAFTRN